MLFCVRWNFDSKKKESKPEHLHTSTGISKIVVLISISAPCLATSIFFFKDMMFCFNCFTLVGRLAVNWLKLFLLTLGSIITYLNMSKSSPLVIIGYSGSYFCSSAGCEEVLWSCSSPLMKGESCSSFPSLKRSTSWQKSLLTALKSSRVSLSSRYSMIRAIERTGSSTGLFFVVSTICVF